MTGNGGSAACAKVAMPNKATATAHILLTANDPEQRSDFKFTLSSLKPSYLSSSRRSTAIQYARQDFDRHFPHDLHARRCRNAMSGLRNSLLYTSFDKFNKPILSICLRSKIGFLRRRGPSLPRRRPDLFCRHRPTNHRRSHAPSSDCHPDGWSPGQQCGHPQPLDRRAGTTARAGRPCYSADRENRPFVDLRQLAFVVPALECSVK